MEKRNLIKVGAATGVAVIGLGLGTLLTPSLASAEDADSVRADIYSRVIEKLGLSVSAEELQSAVSEARYEVKAEMLQQNLDEAVAEGSITQEQADLALEVEAAMEIYREENRHDPAEFIDMTHEERKAAMDEERDAMQASIAEEVGITTEDLEALREALREAGVMPGFGRGHGRMMGGEFDKMSDM